MKRSVLIPLVIAIFFTLSLSTRLQAQIQAPALICIDNDTLVWETPVNTCGAFQGYIILASQNEEGPYMPLDTIRNQNETTYFHQDAGGNAWYYYLESDFDCPGLSRLTSDTLDNRIPEIGPLLSVTVQSRDVVLDWAPSPSPETAGYIISKNTSAGTITIDTVYNQTTYTDFNTNATERVETYFVTAIDRCGNTSLVGAPHSTMLLESGEINPCLQSIELSWTPYIGWDNGPERYEILIYSNGNDPIIGSTGGNTTSYTFDQINDGEIYCFTIRAIEAGGNYSALSNAVCEGPEVVQPIRELFIPNVSFNDNESVTVNWHWNTNAQLTQATLLRSLDNGPFSPVQSIDLSGPRLTENTFTDTNLPSGEGQICYRVETLDECGATAESNVGCTINISAISDGQGSNQISWTPFDFDQTNTLNYELFRVEGGSAQSVSILNGNESSFLDQTDLSNNASGITCYYVIANAEIALPNGSISQVATRSNLACTEQSSAIYIPNAFAPAGINTEFRAYLQFGLPAEFRLEVYDRWGNKVFQGQSIDQGWDGTKNGQDLPSGVYVYRLLLTQNNGNVIEKAGSVALIR